MPPMLDIAFAELTRRAAQQVLAREARLGVDERHRVLQLVAEAERGAGLVAPAARPQAARQGLVEEPAVREYVEGRIGGFHLHRAKRTLPVLLDLFQRAARRRRRASRDAEREDDLARLPVGQIESDLQGTARIEPRAYLVRQLRAAHRRRIPQRAVASDELGAVSAHRPGRVADAETRGPAGELDAVGVARVQRAAGRIDLGGHVHGGFRPQVTQHPLDLAGGGERARAARAVADFQYRELDCRLPVRVDAQLRTYAILRVLEDAVDEA